MIAVSDEFKAIWRQKQGKGLKHRLAYKRRYKSGGVWQNEADWKYLDPPDFLDVGEIPVELDAPFNNVFRSTVITLRFPNPYNEWIETTVPPSFFAADAVAADGYRAYKTIWRYEVGYELSDGTTEWIPRFTGRGLKPRITGKGAEAEIQVHSNAILLETADAEEVAEALVASEDCTPAADGVVKEFETTSVGVDHIGDWEVDGANLDKGSQYNVSNDNEIPAPGNTGKLKITADTAPANGVTVKAINLKKWFRDKKIEDLLGRLADEAGILSVDRSIAPVLFPGGLSGSKTIDSQAEWEAGSAIADVETDKVPGSIQPYKLLDDFADGDYTADPVWTEHAILGDASASVVDGYLSLVCNVTSGPLIALGTPLARTSGVWRQRVWQKNITGNGFVVLFFGVDAPVEAGGDLILRGYGLWFKNDADVVLMKYDGQAFGTGTVLVNCGRNSKPDAIWVVTMSPSGDFVVYNDGVQVGTGTDTDFTSCAHYAVGLDGVNAEARITDIRYGSSYVVDYDSQEFDLLSAPSAWGVLEALSVLSGWALTLFTNVADVSGGPYDGWVQADGSLVPQSALKRYVKVRARLTPPASGTGLAELQRLQLNFTTTDVFVSLAKHRGSCMAEFQDYVKLADYEMLFQADGKLVVRAKDTAQNPAVELDQENGIIDITDVDYGIPDRVVRKARVRHRGFVAVYGDDEAGVAADVKADGDELGTKVLDEDLSDKLLANDVDIATGRARARYEAGRRASDDPRPPVRMTVQMWLVPWLEAGDEVTIDYFDNPYMRQMQANDELNVASSPYFTFDGDAGNIISRAKDWKVLAYRPNFQTDQAEALVEEVPA